jgi:hypothetical protein
MRPPQAATPRCSKVGRKMNTLNERKIDFMRSTSFKILRKSNRKFNK